MNNYLTKFNTITEYNDFIDSNDCPYVNVSYIGTTDEVKYFKDTDIHEDTYFNMPFTIEILSIGQNEPNCTLFIHRDTSSYTKYKINNGEWIITDSNEYLTLNNIVVGDKVQIINITNRTNNDSAMLGELDIWRNESWDDRIGGDIKVYGNIMSIFNGDEYLFAPTFPDYANVDGGNGFFTKFIDPGRVKDILVNAENLWLPYRNLPICAFRGMFMSYYRLVKGPDILAIELPDTACHDMFSGCTSLTHMPVIAAKKINNWSLRSMFLGCTSLVNTTPLHIEHIKYNDSMHDMFQGCSSLTAVPQWTGACTFESYPGDYIYSPFQGMFYGCGSLTDASNINMVFNFDPASNNAFDSMFAACSNLVTGATITVNSQTGQIENNNNIYDGCDNLQTIRYYSDIGSFNFGNLPDNGGTFYYKDGVSYNPADYVPGSWTCTPAQI